ncbi:cytoplasmic protein [Salmonella enterica]|uniref:cytoplasmic protein n=1 Tax=Escherichia coli TaxID=562 RepID=UPI00259C9D4F|nr:cytoplasmic protein [Escherichia coli]EDZ1687065.1 cytoplasmic protein [Salmonella enterica]EEB5060329.1 cytoplasmic protein [Salmonella enterica]EKK4450634.1 cytoplasmic protein [Salmonella enterica]MDM4819692.1 cytoplasmic protein [Escherichia coli]MDM4847674.1 cytoplasmic protein [Escherichia coli]
MIERTPIEQARSYFFSQCQYTEEHLERDYQTEILRYSDDTWEYPQRAARLSAAVKRYKTYQMLCFIFLIASEKNLDFTPLVVKRLCESLFGRKGSQDFIVEIFGQKGRSHRSNDSSPKVIEGVANQYRALAALHWSDTLAVIEKVKRDYRKKIKAINKPSG